MPVEEPTHESIQRRYESVSISRRSLGKLAGIAGVTVLTGGQLSGAAAQDTNDITITMNITPTFDRVLIEEEETEDRTGSGARPGQGAEYLRGIVRATGDGDHVEEGDSVFFFDDGVLLEIAGEEHHIVDEGDIIAIIED